MEKNTKILIATVSLLAVGFLMWSKAKAAPAKASSPIKSDDKNKPEAAGQGKRLAPASLGRGNMGGGMQQRQRKRRSSTGVFFVAP